MRPSIIKTLCALLLISITSLATLWSPGITYANPVGQNQFMGDVNGDGKADAITFDIKTGDWWVALSNGVNGFQPPSRWMSGFGIGTSKQFVSDITGDGKADLITFDKTTGDWWVAVSNGVNKFQPPSRWISGLGIGSTNQMMGDVNGDGKADVVLFFDRGAGWSSGQGWSSGAWIFEQSVGNGFGGGGILFNGGLGVGSTSQFVADVNGDGKADAIVYFKQTGDWWISNSDGAHFATIPYEWAHGWGVNAPDQFVADVNGDGKADAIISDSPYGNNDFAMLSNGSTFNTITNMSGEGWGNSNIFMADVFGNGRAQPVVFDKYTGSWTVGGTTWINGLGVGTN